jgi:hypothetical protein
MVAPLVVAGGIMAVGAVSGFLGGKKAAKQAKKAGQMSANLKIMETNENLRRTQFAQTQVMGEARAKVFASNLQMKGSPQDYLRILQSEQRKELDWMKKAGTLEANAIKAGGQATARSLMTSATSSLLTGLASSVATAYSPGKT